MARDFGKGEREFGPFGVAAGERDVASVCAGQLARQAEPETLSAGFGAVFGAEETLEEPRLIFGRDAGAGIRDAEQIGRASCRERV